MYININISELIDILDRYFIDIKLITDFFVKEMRKIYVHV